MHIFILIIKRIAAVFFVVLFVVVAYFFLFLKGDKDKLPDLPFIDKTEKITSGASSEDEIAELQRYLSELQQVRIDSSLFSSSVFKSLKNFKEPLPELKQGRTNPFAPIGRDF